MVHSIRFLKLSIKLFYPPIPFRKDMQILPIEKKFQRNLSLDYRLGLLDNYQMVTKELFLRHQHICVYVYTTENQV